MTDAKVTLMIPLMLTNGMTLAFFLGQGLFSLRGLWAYRRIPRMTGHQMFAEMHVA